MNPVTFVDGNGKNVQTLPSETPPAPERVPLKKDQLRQILQVAKAIRQGNFSARFPVEEEGIASEISDVLNDILELNENMIKEFARVSVIVGQEGRLPERASIGPVKGAWATGMEAINSLITNLVQPTNEFARVITSVARGDLSEKMPLEINGRLLKGEYLRIATIVNSMFDQLGFFSSEVSRVAKEVGLEGKLGGQADVKGVTGVWKDLTDNVNQLAGNLTNQVRNIAKVTTAVAKGDLSQKITVDAKGEISELKNTINTMVDQLNSFAAEVTRVAKEVGTEGKLGGQADVKGVSGTWKDLTDNVNVLAGNLTKQVRGIVKVVTAVANGDLHQKFVLEAKGEVAALAETINNMIDTLSTFADQVTTVAREVGIEGQLGGQAKVPGASGVWKDLTDNVNVMASNLTKQVRGIVKVVTAVANGDLSEKFVLEAKGEVAALAETINSMTDTLRTFADQVTTVAREVGIEGKLGGQAKVPGASGIWKDLTDNVNQLAGNLTSQVRAIAEVSTAVTKGDLTRSITVQAQGEVAALKDNINQMIANLKDTTQKNMEQDWLKTNLARFSSMMQGQRNLTAVAQLIMSELTPLLDAQHGTFFVAAQEEGEVTLNLIASYAFTERKHLSNRYRLKESLVGQCAFEKKRILITETPGDYISITSGLGESKPKNILLLPVVFEGDLKAVIELASFKPFSANYLNFLDQLMDSVGVILNMISSTMRTEELLQEVKRSNAELEAQAKELEEKAKLLELKNKEVEMASLSLEEKAEQLSLISKYKSEFLANMSHELRTPLNSLLILSKTLAENKEDNLNPEQVKYAATVHSTGQDLLTLINEILDLSKVEAGKMSIEPQEIKLPQIYEYLEQNFRPLAEHKNLEFKISEDQNLPDTIFTDNSRLQQILKNLLSNAIKFTEKGRVVLQIKLAEKGKKFGIENLDKSPNVFAFSITDTGIGIPKEKQKIIFEAFQQADGTTSRKYGGTGLGLTISREITRLLGGMIEVDSIPEQGSTFTLYLPERYMGAEAIKEKVEFETIIPPLPDDADFKGKKILIVDDDRRNLYALTSILSPKGMNVFHAENGKIGIRRLLEHPDVDLVLMDIMMPEMNGFDAIKAIRKMPKFISLPILSLTAKAMKGDREQCLAAGASDYITKPVDSDRLLALIYAWLNKYSLK